MLGVVLLLKLGSFRVTYLCTIRSFKRVDSLAIGSGIVSILLRSFASSSIAFLVGLSSYNDSVAVDSRLFRIVTISAAAWYK